MKALLKLLPWALLAASPVALAQKLVHSERSMYREVLVYEEGGERCMCFTRMCRIGRQSCLIMDNPRQFALNYARMMMAGTLLTSFYLVLWFEVNVILVAMIALSLALALLSVFFNGKRA